MTDRDALALLTAVYLAIPALGVLAAGCAWIWLEERRES